MLAPVLVCFFISSAHGTWLHMEPLQKKRCVDGLALVPGLSMRGLQKILEKFGVESPSGSHGNKYKRQLDEVLKITTPYGLLVDTMDLPTDSQDKPTHKFHFANPFALLFLLCQTHPRFAYLLHRCRPDGGAPYTLALYTDEATCGNILRPDMDRETECIYWTVAQLPAWWRARKCGWLFFGFLRTKLRLGSPVVLFEISAISRV